MNEVRPFAALRFARDPGPRLAPPYDVIDDRQRDRLASEPENVVHLTLPPGPEGARDYAAAARTLAAWVSSGVLVRDRTPRLYALRERTPGGRVRSGMLALLRLRDYADRIVLPHERTMAGPKRDRLLLTRAIRANLEPLFFLYEDRLSKLAEVFEIASGGERLAECAGPDGTRLTLRALDDAPAIAEFAAFLADRPVIVADGHHRYETMLSYRDERRTAARERALAPAHDAPYEFVVAYLVNAFDAGSVVRAIHRLVRGAGAEAASLTLRARGFALRPLDPALGSAEMISALAEHAGDSHAFALCAAGARWLALRARTGALDVQVLHGEVLPELAGELSFDADPVRSLEKVHRGEVDLAILLNPLAPDALFEVVQAGELLPQKSTYFSPKIPSGLVLREL
jgi:uncharacterized protein (DUF1015 family)